jgi:hypothetical protein
MYAACRRAFSRVWALGAVGLTASASLAEGEPAKLPGALRPVPNLFRPSVVAASVGAEEDDDLAGSSDLDAIVVDDQDLPGGKGGLRAPTLGRLLSGFGPLLRLPWDVLVNEEDARARRRKQQRVGGDEEEVDDGEKDDSPLTFEELVNATALAVSVPCGCGRIGSRVCVFSQPELKSKPVSLIVIKTMKSGLGEDTFGADPLGGVASAVTGLAKSILPTKLLRRALFSRTPSLLGEEEDHLLEETADDEARPVGSTDVGLEGTVPGDEQDDAELGMGEAAGSTFLVQTNVGLGNGSLEPDAPSDGLDLMVVPLLVLGKWTLAGNCQRIHQATLPILIPNARRSGGRTDATFQAVLFPETGNPMMASGLVSSNVTFKSESLWCWSWWWG